MGVLWFGFFFKRVMAHTRLQDLSMCPKAHSGGAGLLRVGSFALGLTIATE